MLRNEQPHTPTIEMTGRIRNGKFYVDDARTLAKRVATLPDGPAILHIDVADEPISPKARRHYHAILNHIAHARGVSHNDVDDYYRDKFNDGKSSDALTKRAYSHYVNLVMADAAAEAGVEFPVWEPKAVDAEYTIVRTPASLPPADIEKNRRSDCPHATDGQPVAVQEIPESSARFISAEENDGVL